MEDRTLKAIQGHYEATFGPPSSGRWFKSKKTHMDVLKWSPETNDQGVYLYATVGAAVSPIPDAPKKHRQEFYLGVLPDADEESVSATLAGAAALHLHAEKHTGAGDTVTDPERTLWPKTEMRSLWLRPQIDDDPLIPTLELADNGLHIQFVHVVPMYEEEVKELRQRGHVDFWRAWADSGVPFWDPYRDAVKL